MPLPFPVYVFRQLPVYDLELYALDVCMHGPAGVVAGAAATFQAVTAQYCDIADKQLSHIAISQIGYNLTNNFV